jgi:hypothetical protein
LCNPIAANVPIIVDRNVAVIETINVTNKASINELSLNNAWNHLSENPCHVNTLIPSLKANIIIINIGKYITNKNIAIIECFDICLELCLMCVLMSKLLFIYTTSFIFFSFM